MGWQEQRHHRSRFAILAREESLLSCEIEASIEMYGIMLSEQRGLFLRLSALASTLVDDSLMLRDNQDDYEPVLGEVI